MADVLNTETCEMRASVNEAQAPYNAPPWIIITREQFDLWSTIPQRYRKWTGVAIEEFVPVDRLDIPWWLIWTRLMFIGRVEREES